MKRTWARAACSHPALSGISRAHLGGSLEEIYPTWQARRESELHKQRGEERRRAAGAGRLPKLEFVDRVLVTLVHLRLDMPHAVLAELYDVDRSTISAAIRDVRSLLAVLTSNTAPHHPSGTPTGTGSGGSTPASLRAERHPAAGPERTRRAAAPGTPTSRGEVGFSELAKHERGRSGGGLGTGSPRRRRLATGPRTPLQVPLSGRLVDQ
ncbi:transposase family protein [Streptomyces sp. NBC_00452]|uniref:helix-turn-helix domain-containing protein n=1 Tax=Streptomyces sp. NBC_00452 TaxID=2975746 RepID=UPI002256CFF9|nr:transposase family protein [Streptomyces sp. NBC_00452]MCX5063633.1 transposase family protein [Streptomyces sp. NBC_00452]